VQYISWIAVAIFLADLAVRVGLSVRVIMRRRPVGVSLAWLAVILIFPLAGAAIYLMIGELRLGNRRAQWAARIHEPYQAWLGDLRTRCQVDWSSLGVDCQPIARLCEATVGIPAIPGNHLQILDRTEDFFQALIADIDSAMRTCHLEFYIWHSGGLAEQVAAALIRAAGRGVVCRVLLDAVGSRDFLRSTAARELRTAGVALHAALPVGLFRNLLVRFDLRLHRKIVVIDGEIAYAGSSNLVDPRYFKLDAGVGQWVDAMARIRGSAVEALAITFLEDWELETGEGVGRLSNDGDVRPLPAHGPSTVQVIPSGPTLESDAMQAILLMAIYSADAEIVLTTPYFVAEEPLLTALKTAAARGVRVTVVVPERVDSKLVRLATRAHQGDLLAAGVHVVLFRAGLLHTKSITVDGQFSLFGSLNLDPRSLFLNFEITLAVYDPFFTSSLRSLQESYIENSSPMDLEAWLSRRPLERFTENAARLLGPLL
jgi:cardiolipin synthase